MSRNPADRTVTNRERRLPGSSRWRRRLPEALRAVRTGDGFTLIELLLSIVIISVGIVGFASAVGLASMEMWYGKRDTDISMLVTQRLERLKAMPYDEVQSGGQTEGAYDLSWVVEEGRSKKKVTLSVAYRGATGASRADTLVTYVTP